MNKELEKPIYRAYESSERISELWPEVERIEIFAHIVNKGLLMDYDKESNSSYKSGDVARFLVYCPNRECTQGGFDLYSNVSKAVSCKAENTEGFLRCTGHTAPDHPEHQCETILTYRIRVEFRKDSRQ